MGNLIIFVEKPISPESQVLGKVLPVKKWVKFKLEMEKIYPTKLKNDISTVFEKENFLVFFVRNKEDFVKTFKHFQE